ncbi:MAG: XRE family transcriptional regulator [Lachnospiraceae bacterium]|nr:XRE family transcriptional regulator [Lachnospiraceae bacterium]MCI9133346.1 XRE family transcriptional regulator [Lachnospiraceae bacterium]
MAETEIKIREMIIERYGSLNKFCEIIGMPWTTLDSILKRGIANSNITNVIKITKELGIDTESLATGTIVKSSKKTNISTIAAHKDGENFTPDELAKIEEYKKLLLAARPKG